MVARVLSFEDHLPLRRLYERFDAIAEGRAPGNSTAAHRAVLDRLDGNRRVAEALGWTRCSLERLGGSGRLVSFGAGPVGGERAVVPDWIPAQLRSREVAHSPRAGSAIDLPRRAAAQHAYDEVKGTIRTWFLSARPEMDAQALERAALRMAAAAVRFRDGSARSRQASDVRPGEAARHPNDPATENRWFDDGGR